MAQRTSQQSVRILMSTVQASNLYRNALFVFCLLSMGTLFAIRLAVDTGGGGHQLPSHSIAYLMSVRVLGVAGNIAFSILSLISYANYTYTGVEAKKSLMKTQALWCGLCFLLFLGTFLDAFYLPGSPTDALETCMARRSLQTCGNSDGRPINLAVFAHALVEPIVTARVVKYSAMLIHGPEAGAAAVSHPLYHMQALVSGFLWVVPRILWRLFPTAVSVHIVATWFIAWHLARAAVLFTSVSYKTIHPSRLVSLYGGFAYGMRVVSDVLEVLYMAGLEKVPFVALEASLLFFLLSTSVAHLLLSTYASTVGGENAVLKAERDAARTQLEATKQEMAARQSAEAGRQRFMRYVFHEVRVPFNSIIMGLEVLADEEVQRLSKSGQVVLDMLGKSAGAARTLLNDVLDFSKIENGAFQISLVTARLRELVQVTTLSMMAMTRDPDVRVELCTDVDTALPELLLADKVRLQQVVANLISNAIKFSPHDGTGRVHVTLRTIPEAMLYVDPHTGALLLRGKPGEASQSGDPAQDELQLETVLRRIRWRDPANSAGSDLYTTRRTPSKTPEDATGVTVNDTVVVGGGWAPGELGMLFTAFRQLDAGLQYKGKGTGLGLAICHEIISLHGGRVGVYSSGVPGEGAQFSVLLRLPVLQRVEDTEQDDTTCRCSAGNSPEAVNVFDYDAQPEHRPVLEIASEGVAPTPAPVYAPEPTADRLRIIVVTQPSTDTPPRTTQTPSLAERTSHMHHALAERQHAKALISRRSTAEEDIIQVSHGYHGLSTELRLQATVNGRLAAQTTTMGRVHSTRATSLHSPKAQSPPMLIRAPSWKSSRSIKDVMQRHRAKGSSAASARDSGGSAESPAAGLPARHSRHKHSEHGYTAIGLSPLVRSVPPPLHAPSHGRSGTGAAAHVSPPLGPIALACHPLADAVGQDQALPAPALRSREAEQVASKLESACRWSTPTRRPLRVLVVDDMADNRRLLARSLAIKLKDQAASFAEKGSGVESTLRSPSSRQEVCIDSVTIDQAEDGHVALAMILQGVDAAHVKACCQDALAEQRLAMLVSEHRAQVEYDVITMDAEMPTLSGFATTRLLRQAGYTGLILGCTGNGLEQDRALLISNGCDDVFVKPLSVGDVASAIVARLRQAGREP